MIKVEEDKIKLPAVEDMFDIPLQTQLAIRIFNERDNAERNLETFDKRLDPKNCCALLHVGEMLKKLEDVSALCNEIITYDRSLPEGFEGVEQATRDLHKAGLNYWQALSTRQAALPDAELKAALTAFIAACPQQTAEQAMAF